jgi:hypothetical protein
VAPQEIKDATNRGGIKQCKRTTPPSKRYQLYHNANYSPGLTLNVTPTFELDKGKALKQKIKIAGLLMPQLRQRRPKYMKTLKVQETFGSETRENSRRYP